jgi:hypothetical protein
MIVHLFLKNRQEAVATLITLPSREHREDSYPPKKLIHTRSKSSNVHTGQSPLCMLLFHLIHKVLHVELLISEERKYFYCEGVVKVFQAVTLEKSITIV